MISRFFICKKDVCVIYYSKRIERFFITKI
jgi:hypothetical protein